MKKTNLLVFAVLIVLASGCAQDNGKIFNGKDLSNWNFVVENGAVPGEQVYTVKDGQIAIKGEPLGYMYTKEKYANYTLELEYRWAEEASNSGIFVLIEDPKNPFATGIEVQLAAGKAGDFVLLAGSDMKEYTLPEGVTERPKFPVIQKKQPSSENPAGEWNKVKITVQDGVVDVYVNDVHQNTGTGLVKEGNIGLQSEGKEILFRNLVLTKM
ncbi:MAG TPA: DUF1080 domain-containing protein [Petrimonas sp.]|nr:DUF1080 domain-containing protein [Petrimonas sp.]HOI80211.1 DUF1080 domain-containing protein [Petrimonas sp.]